MFLSIGIKYTIIIVSLVVLVMHLGTFPPTRLLSGISSALNLVFYGLFIGLAQKKQVYSCRKPKDRVNCVQSSLKSHPLWVTLDVFCFNLYFY